MKKKRIKIYIVLVIFFFTTIFVYVAINKGLKENLFAQGEALLKNKALGIMNAAVRDVLAEMGDMSGFLYIEKDENGKIALISTDTTTINQVANKCVSAARDKLASLEQTTIAVPLGNVLGSKLFSGLGPKIKTTVIPMGTATAGFFTEFESAGINQTRYKVYIVLEAYMRLVYGSASLSTQVSTEVLISEAIIIGDVPDTYANLPSSGDFLNLIP
jgi:sporulation protein YunB